MEKEYYHRYYKNNKKLLCQKARSKYYTPKGRFIVYRNRAKHRKIAFDLTLEIFNEYWQKPCYYCGNKIDTIGLDRINNDIGYLEDNIVSCCRECNIMKRAMTQKHFINQCKKISNRFFNHKV